MKYYLYHFKYISGDITQTNFYADCLANNPREAIITIVASFLGELGETAEEYIEKELGKGWTVKQFCEDMDSDFIETRGWQAYRLYWIKELPDGIENLGKDIIDL